VLERLNIFKAVNPFVALLLFYFFLTLVLYGPSYGTMLIDDGISGLWEIEHSGKSWLDSYGFDSFYHGHYSLLIFLKWLFGLNPLGWFIVFAFLHALNASLIKLFFEKLYKAFGFGNAASRIAYAGSAFFLISPYMTENVNWAATGHYAISLLCLLLMSIMALDLLYGVKRNLALIFLIFFISLFTHEISFLFPIFLGLLLIVLGMKDSRTSWKKLLPKIVGPQFVLIGIYLLLLKWKRGTFIPHYGGQEGFWSSFLEMPSLLAKYLLKLLGFVHFFSVQRRDAIYNVFENPMLAFLLIVAVLLLFFFLLKKSRKSLMLFGLLSVSFILFLLPALRLYFTEVVRLENARYSYFAFVFLAQLIALVIFSRKSPWAWTLFGVYAAISVGLLVHNVNDRAESGPLHAQYLAELNKKIVPNAYLLNVPASQKGAYMFRARGRLAIAYEMNYNQKLPEGVEEVCSYVGVNALDSFEVKQIDDSTYHVQNLNPGSWFMVDGLGLSDFETEDYSLKTDEWGGYTLKFRTLPIPRLFIFSKGKLSEF